MCFREQSSVGFLVLLGHPMTMLGDSDKVG